MCVRVHACVCVCYPLLMYLLTRWCRCAICMLRMDRKGTTSLLCSYVEYCIDLAAVCT